MLLTIVSRRTVITSVADRTAYKAAAPPGLLMLAMAAMAQGAVAFPAHSDLVTAIGSNSTANYTGTAAASGLFISSPGGLVPFQVMNISHLLSFSLGKTVLPAFTVPQLNPATLPLSTPATSVYSDGFFNNPPSITSQFRKTDGTYFFSNPLQTQVQTTGQLAVVPNSTSAMRTTGVNTYSLQYQIDENLVPQVGAGLPNQINAAANFDFADVAWDANFVDSYAPGDSSVSYSSAYTIQVDDNIINSADSTAQTVLLVIANKPYDLDGSTVTVWPGSCSASYRSDAAPTYSIIRLSSGLSASPTSIVNLDVANPADFNVDGTPSGFPVTMVFETSVRLGSVVSFN